MSMSNGINGTHDPDEGDGAGPPDGADVAQLNVPDPDIAVDAQTIFEELSSAEIAARFSVRDGRLFHSHGSSPYPLPTDTPELERLTLQHAVLRAVLNGSNFFGPTQEVLANNGTRRHVVDLGTAAGIWVLEMARQFPLVRFDGIDMVPLATRSPPSNVLFHIQDISGPMPYQNGSIDLINARSVELGVRNYPALIREVARVLRPGGLFLSGEFAMNVVMHAIGNAPPARCPGITRFFEQLTAALQAVHGVQPVGPSIPEYLRQSSLFTDITARAVRIPVGDWPDVEHAHASDAGIQVAHVIHVFATGTRDLFRQAHLPENEIDNLIQNCQEELRTSRGLCIDYYTVHATRL